MRRRVINSMTGPPALSETPDQRNEAANPQWGGRFAAGPSVVMQEINASIGFDRKLWRQDIRRLARARRDAGEDRA